MNYGPLTNNSGVPAGRYAPVTNFGVILFGGRKLDNTQDTTRWRGQVMLRHQFAGLVNTLLR
ncbi:MAG: hypothetical protein IH935_03045 [Acidobacteria bacterium]|nr:hypothetical protein [Acidobacteriota bacterium]